VNFYSFRDAVHSVMMTPRPVVENHALLLLIWQ